MRFEQFEAALLFPAELGLIGIELLHDLGLGRQPRGPRALDEFDGERWTREEREIPDVNQADGTFPLPRGLDEDVARVEQSWELTLEDGFDTRWLPTPYPVSSIDVQGDWRWDATSLDVELYDDELDTDGLTYEVDALEEELSAAIATIHEGDFRPTPSEFACSGCPALDVVCAGPRLAGAQPAAVSAPAA